MALVVLLGIGFIVQQSPRFLYAGMSLSRRRWRGLADPGVDACVWVFARPGGARAPRTGSCASAARAAGPLGPQYGDEPAGGRAGPAGQAFPGGAARTALETASMAAGTP